MSILFNFVFCKQQLLDVNIPSQIKDSFCLPLFLLSVSRAISLQVNQLTQVLNKLFVVLNGHMLSLFRSFLLVVLNSNFRHVPGFDRQSQCCSRHVALSAFLQSLHNLHTVSSQLSSVLLFFEFDGFTASWTFGFFNEPGAQTSEVKHVTAVELFAAGNLTKTNATLELLLLRRLHVFERLKFMDKLPPLVK